MKMFTCFMIIRLCISMSFSITFICFSHCILEKAYVVSMIHRRHSKWFGDDLQQLSRFFLAAMHSLSTSIHFHIHIKMVFLLENHLDCSMLSIYHFIFLCWWHSVMAKCGTFQPNISAVVGVAVDRRQNTKKQTKTYT